ncbi:MAG: TIGR01777 family oxidoreductase [Elusimicrobiota bacterium]
MKVLVSGSTGFVGSHVLNELRKNGHTPIRLMRAASVGNDVLWDSRYGQFMVPPAEQFDAVVHLSGENIVNSRWNDDFKKKIRDSRVKYTQQLVSAVLALPKPPTLFICASAIGFYGDRGEDVLTEESSKGEGFLADVCQEWENATSPLKEKNIRVANMRFGVILGAGHGALKNMKLPFKLGLGGVIGSGKQYWSWIDIADAAKAIVHTINTPAIQGPVNVVAPQPVTNKEFTEAMGYVLSRPTLFPMPAFAAKLAFGEMAEALFLASNRIKPAKLEANGFKFDFPDLKGCLSRHLN